ncbi:MAG: response regulator transcription factor [Cyanobacteria bacterium P01_A01_bin.83]
MIKILIVDDQKTVQEILSSYVNADPGLELIGCADNGQEAIELIKVHHPHIVLMDIEMPIMDGLEATQIISEKFINTSVLIITVHNEDSYLNSAVQVGAKGYLKKNTPEKELINAIYSAYKGYFQLGPGLLERYLYNAAASQSNSQEIEQLKSVILQQSKLLDNLNPGASKQGKNQSRGNSKNAQSRGGTSLENKHAALEKQVYYLANRIEQINKKTDSNQQLSALAMLCNIFLGVAFVISVLSSLLS